MSRHSYNIQLDQRSQPFPISFTLPNNAFSQAIPDSSVLRFLSVVDTTQVPLHLVVGSPHIVKTTSQEANNWFSSILLSRHVDDDAWWRQARPDSVLGILCAVDTSVNKLDGLVPTITEVLFYASRSATGQDGRPLTPPPSWDANGNDPSTGLEVHALYLSSHLLHSEPDTSPPSSLVDTGAENPSAVFLPSRFSAPDEDEVIHEPPVKKRRTAADSLDQAEERRRAARKAGGEGVAAAAAGRADSLPTLPTLGHRRSISGAAAQASPRVLSRSPSVSNSRPGSVRGTAAPPNRSGLYRVQSLSTFPVEQPAENEVETANKLLVTRIVMAGLRLYGYSQSKNRKSRAGSGASSPAADVVTDDPETAKKKDEEYKLLYHQVYKGVCFAFRAHIGTKSLQNENEALRECADKLLGIYCSDPLIQGFGAG